MKNSDKYKNVFVKCFSVSESDLNDNFVYQSIPEWDSVGHMNMIGEIEEVFGIMMEMDDIIEFDSYRKGFDILKNMKLYIINNCLQICN